MACFEKRFQAGAVVIQEGESGEAFYIIRRGSVGVNTEAGGSVATLREGAFFGEMALLNDEPCRATVTAETELLCLVLQRVTFSKLLGPIRALLGATAEKRAEMIERLSLAQKKVALASKLSDQTQPLNLRTGTKGTRLATVIASSAQFERAKEEFGGEAPSDKQTLVVALDTYLRERKLKAGDLLKTWDNNGDGAIDCDEFLEHVKKMELGEYDDAEIIALFNALDEDGSGVLELTELQELRDNLSAIQAEEAAQPPPSPSVPSSLPPPPPPGGRTGGRKSYTSLPGARAGSRPQLQRANTWHAQRPPSPSSPQSRR
eukprot:6062377-Prymnesium_polylepis.1